MSDTSAPQKYRRILLKVSGEVLMGDTPYGIDTNTVQAVAEDVAEIVKSGVELCLVIGGGNIFRGMAGAAKGMERSSADYMGMLATVMNAILGGLFSSRLNLNLREAHAYTYGAHSAFDDPTASGDAPARASIEVRALLFFEDRTRQPRWRAELFTRRPARAAEPALHS